MKYAIFAIVALSVAVFAMVSGGDGYITVTQAQEPPPPPQSLTAVNGLNLGTASLTWTTVPGVSSYRVGWLAKEDYLAYIDNDIWEQKFAYSDVESESTWTVTRLTPGADYYLIVGRKHDGGNAWSEWQELTLNADESSCPTDTTGTTQPPTTVVAGDYDADNDGLIEIRTLAQLDAIRYDLDGDGLLVDNADAYADAFPDAITDMGCPDGCYGYELVANLDFDTNGNGRVDAGDDYWNDGAGWEPMGRYSSHNGSITVFTGTFDGGNHTISNLYINRVGGRYDKITTGNYTGLFRGTGVGGTINRIRLVSVKVTGSSPVGGLVGSNDGTITASYTTGRVTSNGSSIGGLVGNNDGTITASYTTGSVTGGSYVGGLVGRNFGGTITASYATGRVTGSSHYVGGLVGSNEGTITASYATGSVTSNGGDAGGLVGSNEGTITASYATGRVTGSSDAGGLVGETSGGITASYWDTQTTGQTSSAGSEDSAGKTTAELQMPTSASGIYATWDPDVWDFGTSSQYPALKAEGLSVADQR